MYLIFHRENNKFNDILTDPVIKKAIRTKISFYQHLILELDTDKNTTYAMIKYGDDTINVSQIVNDLSPIPGKDYVPIRKERGKGLGIIST